MGLPAWICNDDGIGRIVDDNRVVDVVVNDVIRRRCHIFGCVDPDRYRRIGRNRKDKREQGWWRRSQIHKVDWTRRQEKYRGWWRRFKSEIRIVKNQYRPLDINHFFRRRRRDIVDNDFKTRRWLKSRS